MKKYARKAGENHADRGLWRQPAVSERNQRLDHGQADTAEQQWLMQHCHEYGFILRYPEDKQDITMIGYEPWHYRYVGKEAAKEIMEQGVCLEEYLGEIE